jgi:RNA polymerase sigma-70 factor (ECF subfamily)
MVSTLSRARDLEIGEDAGVSSDEGFRPMYEAEFANVYQTVLLMCGDRSIAEDATREAFARALARWRRLAGTSWAAGWITTTAINVARRQLRTRPTIHVQPTAEADRDATIDLRSAIEHLPARQNRAIALHYLMDLTIADAAAAMGSDEGTVKTHLSRGRSTLSRVLGGQAKDEPRTQRGQRHG